MKAVANGLSVSPRKMNVVASLVRGRSVSDAVTILEHTPRKAAGMLRDVIQSAASNAEHNDKYDTANLYVEVITVGSGGMRRTVEFRARGGANLRRSRMRNVRVALAQTGESNGS